MGIAQIALEPPPLCQTGKHGKKSAPNHPGKPLQPPSLTGNAHHMETTHFKKGLPLVMTVNEC